MVNNDCKLQAADEKKRLKDETGISHSTRFLNRVVGEYDAVPGLRSDSPPPAPNRPSTTCPNCEPLRETVKVVFAKLQVAKNRVNAAIRVGEEAVERSAARVGVYDVLEEIRAKHGTPFKDTDRLPKEYRARFPRHEHDDPLSPIPIDEDYPQKEREKFDQDKYKQIASRQEDHMPDFSKVTEADGIDLETRSASTPTSVPEDFNPGSSSEDDSYDNGGDESGDDDDQSDSSDDSSDEGDSDDEDADVKVADVEQENMDSESE